MSGKLKFAGMLMLLIVVSVVPAFGQTPLAPEDRIVGVFGQSIHYWDVGQGPVVVLVHGLGSSKDRDWGRVVQPLSQHYRVLALDQIGFGRSDKPLLDYSVQTYVDFLNEFLHNLRIEKATLIGESLGGWISALYTLESGSDAHMVPVEKLVLADAAGLKQDKPIPDLNPSSLEGMRKLLQAVFYDTSWMSDAVVRRAYEDRIKENASATVRSIMSNPALNSERLDDKLGGIHAPTLVVWGKNDALLPVAAGQRYAAGIAGAKLVTFDKCGHVPPMEVTPQFLAAVTAFLSDGVAH
jgi:pimeloyl-ACP methyl ester carboxylesterase